MVLEIRYINTQTNQYNFIYVGFPSRYDGCLDLAVNRIFNKPWRKMALDAFWKNAWYGAYNSFTKDFKEFLSKKFSIGYHDSNKYLFYGIKPYEEPIVVPFLSK